ncbi:unnamed protein product [Caenorhabditis angaria]|uniref:F-box domain-containing protein n=1 Tax=Caenorhabditis angaria TaxID=860376 RepID=A0A9P1I912_9PELO|nr:unnamed protein product [Caenorhabditis angaria]
MEVDDNLDPTGWFDIPFEMREMVINYMDLATKIQFSQCSKLCFEESQLFDSSYFSCSIKNNCYGENKGVFFQMSSLRKTKIGFIITNFLVCDIPNVSEGELMNLRSQYKNRLIELETREQVTDFVMYLLRGILKFVKNSLRSLWISIPDFPYNKMKIENNLNKLESIALSSNINPISCGFIDFEQLCSIQKDVSISNLTIEQIFQLKSKTIFIRSDGSEQFDIEKILNRLFTVGIDQNVYQIIFESRIDLDNTPGLYAKRVTRYQVEYLFKQMSKIIWIECPGNMPAMKIHCRAPPDFNESEWTIFEQ